MTADPLDLAEFLRPGDRVAWRQACAEPQTLTEPPAACAETAQRVTEQILRDFPPAAQVPAVTVPAVTVPAVPDEASECGSG